MVNKWARQLHARENAFTLIELLVVIAILGALAAVAIPNVGKFFGKGKTESYATELHNVQAATTAMLYQSTTKAINLDGESEKTFSSFDQIVTTDTPDPLVLKDYLSRLKVDFSSLTGCSYTFKDLGGNPKNYSITQITPTPAP